jgi:hypothetical protein
MKSLRSKLDLLVQAMRRERPALKALRGEPRAVRRAAVA